MTDLQISKLRKQIKKYASNNPSANYEEIAKACNTTALEVFLTFKLY